MNQTHSHTYQQPLKFYFTDNPGIWVGKWEEPILDRIDFHDTLVDVGHIKDNGQYAWVLEF